MANNFVTVTDREDYVQWLKNAVGKDAEIVVADQDAVERVLQLIDATSSNIVFVQLNGRDSEARISLIEGLLAAKPYLAAVALGENQDNELLLTAMRAGARDFVKVGSEPREVQAQVYRILEKMPRESAPKQQGRIFSFLSARPYEGITTLAVHIALALLEHERSERKVLLLDLGIPAADSLLFLGLKSTYTFGDAIRSVRRFDQTLIKTAFTQHKSGLTILSMPEDPADLRGVTSADVLILLNILKSYFPYIVIHLGGVTPSDFVRLILSKSDKVMLVAEQSVPSCHASKQLLDFLAARDFDVGEIELLIDRYARDAGLDPHEIADLLALPLAATLPPSGMVRLRALNTGRSIFEVAPKDPYAKAVRALAKKLGGEGQAPARRGGFLRWLPFAGRRSSE